MEPLAFTRLKSDRLLAVIRAATPQAAVRSARAVAAGGIALLEVTYTVPDATSAIAELARDASLVVGAGTVLTTAQANAAIGAGARFIVAPNLSKDVAEVARRAGVMFCPGAYTTGEILAARAAGADIVKVYPVGVAGGPAYIQVIRDPLPDVPMLAAGGTNLENVVPFLRAGCLGIGLGGALADPALAASGAFEEITRRAAAFVARLRAAEAAGELPVRAAAAP
jgi:2-dehydro-3-deoxyphosphogluconate aldolase/(4S)-4-hydroxy-2-oxoglutarate aldolase